jgi:ferredoxin
VNRDHEAKRQFDVLLRMPTGERTIQVAEDEHIWDAAFRQGLILPALCHQGWCLTCAGRLEAGEVDQRDSVGFFPQDKDAGFVLLCTGRPLSNLCIRTHQAMAMRKHRLALGLPAPYSTGLKP